MVVLFRGNNLTYLYRYYNINLLNFCAKILRLGNLALILGRRQRLLHALNHHHLLLQPFVYIYRKDISGSNISMKNIYIYIFFGVIT